MRAGYSRMEQFSPTDYAYWKAKGWLEPATFFFTDHARVGFLKGIYPRCVAWMMGRSIDRELAKQRCDEEADDRGGAE